MRLATISPSEIIARYEAVLIDAYGVLVDESGALPGAADFLEALADQDTDFMVVTNDASRLPASCQQRYGEAGLAIAKEKILTSGLLMVPHLQECGIKEGPVCVLGPEDTGLYLTEAGYTLVDPDDDSARALIIGDSFGYEFGPAIDEALSMLVRAFKAGRPVELLCPNPDLTYPRGGGDIGFTAGAVAALFEACLRPRFPEQCPTFARLGKPHPSLFERALQRLGTRKVLMMGDQLQTDIKGAESCGIDSVWVTGDRDNAEELAEHLGIAPTFVMPGF